jgi:hypothetical protein
MLSPLIPLISFPALPLNPLLFAPLCIPGHTLPTALLSSALDTLTEIPQSFSLPLGAILLTPTP